MQVPFRLQARVLPRESDAQISACNKDFTGHCTEPYDVRSIAFELDPEGYGWLKRRMVLCKDHFDDAVAGRLRHRLLHVRENQRSGHNRIASEMTGEGRMQWAYLN